MAQTLACGQVFSYRPTADGFVVFSGAHMAYVTERAQDYCVRTSDCAYFKNFFDLETDYDAIKRKLASFGVLDLPLQFGGGIRILRQDLLEVIISFALSANNNIKRITNTLFALRQACGNPLQGGYFAFPTLLQLQTLTESDFRSIGAGYRSAQLVKLIDQLSNTDFAAWAKLPTAELKDKLLALSGVGTKVADCILLFGYAKTDVFPVDTWIEKVFNQYFGACHNRVIIRRNLVDIFKDLSGYAQQYLFFYQREKSL